MRNRPRLKLIAIIAVALLLVVGHSASAGLFDKLFNKKEKRPPCHPSNSISFGYYATQWQPWLGPSMASHHCQSYQESGTAWTEQTDGGPILVDEPVYPGRLVVPRESPADVPVESTPFPHQPVPSESATPTPPDPESAASQPFRLNLSSHRSSNRYGFIQPMSHESRTDRPNPVMLMMPQFDDNEFDLYPYRSSTTSEHIVTIQPIEFVR